MNNLVIIPARGGSKRIPKKNIRLFCGEPIISYSIRAALESGCFSEVMVSTDSEEIAAVAEKYGAAVPFFRSAESAGDLATTSDVIKEVLEQYRNNGKVFAEVCCLFPTAPFVTAEKLRIAAGILDNDSEVDTVLPVVRFSYPPQRGLIKNGKYLVMREPEHSRTRSQDLPPIYHDAGQFLYFRSEPFLLIGDLMRTKLAPLVISELEVQDIDDETDWVLAEQKYRLMKESDNERKDTAGD